MALCSKSVRLSEFSWPFSAHAFLSYWISAEGISFVNGQDGTVPVDCLRDRQGIVKLLQIHSVDPHVRTNVYVYMWSVDMHMYMYITRPPHTGKRWTRKNMIFK